MAKRLALYARVSTRDKEQNPETQLLRLRDWAEAHPEWTVATTYVDTASANDVAHRIAWRRLLDDAARHRFDAVLVFKLDRALRSVKHMHDTLAVWEPLGIGFLSAQEGFDTTTALGRLLLNLLASLAEFELELIRERVAAGMERARREGRTLGRPPVTERLHWQRDWAAVEPLVRSGALSQRAAAARLDIGVATLHRLLRAPSPVFQNGDAGEES